MKKSSKGGWITYNGRHIFVAHKAGFIKKVDYDEDLKEMVIQFRNKQKYRYQDVKENEALGMVNSSAVGKTFWKKIRREKIFSKEK